MIIESGELNNVAGTVVANCSNVVLITIGYTRVGDYVNVAGVVQCEPTEVGGVGFTIPAPIETGFIDGSAFAGNFSDINGISGTIEPDGNGSLLFNFYNSDGNNGWFYFTGMYKIVPIV